MVAQQRQLTFQWDRPSPPAGEASGQGRPVCQPFSCINYFRELTERLRSQGSNELFLCILNATTDGFQKHQCNGVSYRYPKAQLDLRPSFYATLGLSLLNGPSPFNVAILPPHSFEEEGWLGPVKRSE